MVAGETSAKGKSLFGGPNGSVAGKPPGLVMPSSWACFFFFLSITGV